MNKKLLIYLLGFMTLGYAIHAQAWQHGLSIGYGSGKEINESYRNNGIQIAGKLYKFPKIDETLIATIDVSASEFHAATPNNKLLRTAAISIAPRAYFAPPEYHCIRPYLQTSLGLAYLSTRKFGNRAQGSNAAFQITLESGIEVEIQKQTWDFNLRLVHYCNAGLFDPNDAINVFPMFSIGYLFG